MASLCVGNAKNKRELRKHGGLHWLIKLVEHGSPLARQHAAGAIAIAVQGVKESRIEVA
jgi:hypothetical protein